MRGLLVLFGILAAALAAAILLLPQLIQEPALRTRLLALAQTASGYPLDIEGEVRLALTPLPRLSVDRVTVAMPDGAKLKVDRIDVELALLPLLRGRLDPRHLRLIRPELTLDRLPPNLIVTAISAASRKAGVIRAIDVVDGTFALATPPPSGLPHQVKAAELSLSWEQERQRFLLQGAALVADEPLALRLELEPLSGRGPLSLQLELTVGAPATVATAVYQGGLGRDDGAIDGKLRLSAPQGRLPAWVARLTGTEDLPALPGGFELAGDLALDDEALALTESELALADTRLRGELSVQWSDRPGFRASLEAARMTLTPELEQVSRQLAARVSPVRQLAGEVDLRFASLTWRGAEIRQVRVEADLQSDGQFVLPRLDAILPGETALRWIGGESAADRLVGSLSLQAGELRALLLWLGASPGDLPSSGLASLDLAAQAEVAPDRLSLDMLEARLDATLVAGSISLRHDGRRPRLEAALAADRLNTALYLQERLELDQAPWRRRLAEIDMAIELAVERLSHDAWRDGRLVLKAHADAGQVTVDELHLAAPGGDTLRASGGFDLAGTGYALTGEVSAGASSVLLPTLGLTPELTWLRPLRLSGKLHTRGDVAEVDGRLEAGAITASIAGTTDAGLQADTLNLAGELAVREPNALLAALGSSTPAGEAFGEVAARFALLRNGGPIELRLDGRIGASMLSGQAVLTSADPPSLALAVKAGTIDTGLLVRIYDEMAVQLGVPPGRPWEWPGSWPRQPLRWDWLSAADLRLELAADEVRHQGATLPGGEGTVTLRAGRLQLSDLSVPLASGTLTGTLTLERETGHARLGADLHLRQARVEQLADVLAAGSRVTGELDFGARLRSQGAAIADFVRSVDGEGELTLRQGRLGGVAFPDASSPDPLVEPSLDMLLLKGPFRAIAGIVASEPSGLALTVPGGSARLGLRLDLLAWLAELELDGKNLQGGDGSHRARLIGAPGRLRLVPRGAAQPGTVLMPP